MNLMKAGLYLQGASMDQVDSDMAEFDRIEQAAEQRDMAIQGRVNALWEDKDAICRVIAENSDEIHNLWWGKEKDAEKAIREFIDKCFEVEAISDLNL